MIRRIVTIELLELIQEFPVVCLVGPRQVGKTTLAKQLMRELNKDSVYLDLENPRDENKLADPVLFFEANANKCIILDEIQRMKSLFPILRAMVDQSRVPGRFILLGSASPELIRDSSETLAGRIYFKELMPIHILELNKTSSEIDLLMRGGFPNSLMSSSLRSSFRWRESFIQTYVERDLPLLGLPVAPSESRKLLRMLSHLQGQILNYSSLSKSLGVSAPTVKTYLHFLQQAFLIDLLEPFSTNTGKRLVKSPKIYLRDTGLLHALQGVYDYNDLLAHPFAGAIWEGFVIQQIKMILPNNSQMQFYRTSHGAEIDLILSIPNKQSIGVETKLSSAPSLSRGNYEVMNDLELKMLYVVIPGNESYPLKENVHVMGLRIFINHLATQFNQPT
ncbi:MAG: ATP-binding protein [Bacteroidia bacterium]